MKIKPASVQKLSAYLTLFFLVSIGAYFWEVFLYVAFYHSLVNRGFFHGPWLPVYGSGAVLLAWLLTHLFPDSPSNTDVSSGTFRSRPCTTSAGRKLSVFLCSACSCCLMEYLLGIYLMWRYHIRYWDYRSFPFQLHGYICLYSFLGFGIGGVILHAFLFPSVLSFYRTHAPRTAIKLLLFLSILFLSDFIYSCYCPNTGNNITFPVSVLLKIRSGFSG